MGDHARQLGRLKMAGILMVVHILVAGAHKMLSGSDPLSAHAPLSPSDAISRLSNTQFSLLPLSLSFILGLDQYDIRI
jgi:hypothetical protein